MNSGNRTGHKYWNGLGLEFGKAQVSNSGNKIGLGFWKTL